MIYSRGRNLLQSMGQIYEKNVLRVRYIKKNLDEPYFDTKINLKLVINCKRTVFLMKIELDLNLFYIEIMIFYSINFVINLG